MRATILAIGDEIVGGLTTDTNSGFVARLLASGGVEVGGVLTVRDDEQAILRALRRALEDAELVVTTGGLGPTTDDLTTATVAALAGVPLRLDQPTLAGIEQRFRDRGLEMPANNRKQALLPEGSTIIPNPSGTAPGFICELQWEGRRSYVATMPGVPREMRRMAEETLLPWVLAHDTGQHIGSRTFSTVGLSESRLDELLAGVTQGDAARLSFRAAFPRLQARVSVMAPTDEEVAERLDALESRVRSRLGDHLYAIGDVGLEEVVGTLLREHGRSIAVAESCTGGLIGHRITEVPGSSDYFRLGIVAYSNAAKHAQLGVPLETLRIHGAVSRPVALAMAHGARLAGDADFGLATTGIAGPGGGSAEKPVGTVWIALAWHDGEWAQRFDFGSRSRSWIKEMTAQTALDSLRRQLLV